MSESDKTEALADSEKPVRAPGISQFPPYPDPTDDDFEEYISDDERTYYKTKFEDLNTITQMRIHCTACDRHLGLIPKNENRMRIHPMMHTLVCQTCLSFYNSGEFEKGDDGSELYCRWCGQGGQVYCCSSCPHVFCAKCIKRNLGAAKIKVIEVLDDWKCFKCNPICLKDLRAICWAALRFCSLKRRFAKECVDAVQKQSLINDCGHDYAECCKYRNIRRREKVEAKKKDVDNKKSVSYAVVSKIPPTIQVKKFASINMDEGNKLPEVKKTVKRSASPKPKPYILKKPITVASRPSNTFNVSPLPKKIRVSMPTSSVVNPIRPVLERNQMHQTNSFVKIRPKATIQDVYNGSYNMVTNDNINLSLDSLTQGLDMASMSNMTDNGPQDSELVCTPDFPMEPLCEVTEDNTDDDVQCITPGPSFGQKNPTLAVPCGMNLNDISSDNIVQMTEQDVTVNTSTGGLKFRVDPQTLSAKKMYRLPDGRIFAINVNPNMPGGYSATIVAVTDTNPVKSQGTTYAAKLNHVNSRQSVAMPTIKVQSLKRIVSTPKVQQRRKVVKAARSSCTPTREVDLQVPVEWYRYNLIDAIDALEYSLARLHKLKKEATTSYLRTRTISEVRALHRTLDNLLNTSATRFKEIKDNINKEFKQFISRKTSISHKSDDDDDDVEILPDVDDDPIFIDENSLESSAIETQEVDLTGAGSSEHNESEDILRNRLNSSLESDDNSVTVSSGKSIEDNVNSNTIPKVINLNCDEIVSDSSFKESECNVEDKSKTEQQQAEDKLNHSDSKKISNDVNIEIKNSSIENGSEDSLKINMKEEICTEKLSTEHVNNTKNENMDVSEEVIKEFLKEDCEKNIDEKETCAVDSSNEIKGTKD